MPQQSPRGTYKQIADTLREEIAAHGGPAEQGSRRLGTEAEMSVRFGVARNTLRKALSVLADEGIVYSEPTRGWFVGQASPEAPGPAAVDIAAALARKVRTGECPPGTRFTTAPTIAAEFGVSRHTARLALLSLGTQGLIESRHGRGWFVKAQEQ